MQLGVSAVCHARASDMYVSCPAECCWMDSTYCINVWRLLKHFDVLVISAWYRRGREEQSGQARLSCTCGYCSVAGLENLEGCEDDLSAACLHDGVGTHCDNRHTG